MSTIAGIIGFDALDPACEEQLALMLDAMKPDAACETQTRLLPRCRAALGRVAYGPDRASGSALAGPSDPLCALSVGELYSEETSEPDSAAILADRYRRRGKADFAAGLNGSFAAVLADPHDASVTLITDHTASLALFTTVHAGRLYFASEVKALLAVPDFPIRPDGSSLLSFLTHGFFVARRTLADNIRQMDYATLCSVRDGVIEWTPYWRYSVEPTHGSSRRTLLEQSSGLLQRAVQRRVRTGTCAVLLSGGIDSRGILCCTDDPAALRAVTFSVRAPDQRHPLGDYAVAKQIARTLGMDFSEMYVDSRDFIAALRESVYASEGAAGFIFENVWSDVLERTGADHVLLGDECMGWTNGPVSRRQVLATIGVLSPAALGSGLELLRSELRRSLADEVELQLNGMLNACSTPVPCDQVDELYLQQRLFHFINPKRRVIGRSGLGVRNPWLDLDVLEFVRQLPSPDRVRKQLFRQTLSRLRPDLFRIPRARDAETVDYRPHLVGLEQADRGVNRFVFEDNPLVGEFFDGEAVRNLIETVCRPGQPKPVRNPRDISKWLPTGARQRLSALHSYLVDRAPVLPQVTLLLRVMTMAEALRQLHGRFRNESI